MGLVIISVASRLFTGNNFLKACYWNCIHIKKIIIKLALGKNLYSRYLNYLVWAFWISFSIKGGKT